MCGRFTQAQIAELDREVFKLLEVPALPPRYNIAPTDDAAVVRVTGGGERRLDMLRWGLIPSWSESGGTGPPLINARAESVMRKASFRDAFRQRRCLVPGDGFFEWRRTPHGRQPYYFQVGGGDIFAFAGLWERYDQASEHPVESFTIITTNANALVRPVHDRMPVILDAGAYDAWMDPSSDPHALGDLLQPFPPEVMTYRPVSRQVNNPRNKGPECIQPGEEGE